MRVALLIGIAVGALGCGGPAEAPVAGQLTVIYSARGEGEIAPCGCPRRPLGGLAKRATLIDDARAAGAVVVVDAGSTLAPLVPAGRTHIPPDELPQRQVKARLIAESFAADGLDAIALGAADWSLGADFVRELVAEHALPAVAANLTCDGVAPFPAGRVVERAGLRVGIIGVTDGVVDGCVVSSAEDGFQRAVTELGPVDFTVALVPTVGAMGHALARAGVTADLIVTTSGQSASAGTTDPAGRGWVVSSMSRGKQLGLVRLYPDAARGHWRLQGAADRLGQEVQRLEAGLARVEARRSAAVAPNAAADLALQIASYQSRLASARDAYAAATAAGPGNRIALASVDLDDEVVDQPVAAQRIEGFNLEISGAAGLIGPASARAMRRIARDGPYAGADACVTCHAEIVTEWRTTPHARAWDRLVGERRAADQDCFSCHVTGAQQAGGAQSATDLRGLHGVQCEACHGPSRAHAEDPGAHKAVKSPDVATCTTCHDGDRDGGRFDHATYWPQVIHGQ